MSTIWNSSFSCATQIPIECEIALRNSQRFGPAAQIKPSPTHINPQGKINHDLFLYINARPFSPDARQNPKESMQHQQTWNAISLFSMITSRFAVNSFNLSGGDVSTWVALFPLNYVLQAKIGRLIFLMIYLLSAYLSIIPYLKSGHLQGVWFCFSMYRKQTDFKSWRGFTGPKGTTWGRVCLCVFFFACNGGVALCSLSFCTFFPFLQHTTPQKKTLNTNPRIRRTPSGGKCREFVLSFFFVWLGFYLFCFIVLGLVRKKYIIFLGGGFARDFLV